MKYQIEFSPDTLEHLQCLSARQQTTVLDSVEKQLRDQPAVETKNRKPMRPNPVAPWELRIGNLRVYYDIDESEHMVFIRAVGVKQREQVRIGNEVIKL